MSDINAEVSEWVVSFWKNAETPASEMSEEVAADEIVEGDEVVADEADIEKGGPGSGEPAGHPFRGNRYTGGVQSAGHHETRAGTENYSHHEHLTAASAHAAAGRTAMAHGEHGIARKHFNEAAYHASQASSLIQHGAGNREMGHHAEMLYHAAHHAGDAAERAGYLKNKLDEAVRLGRGSTVVARDQLRGTASAENEGHAPTSTSNRDRGGALPDNRLVPEGTPSSRIISTDELRSAVAQSQRNAEAQSNLVGAAESAASMARGVSAPMTVGSATAVNQ